MNEYFRPVSIGAVGKMYRLVHRLDFWQGIMRRVRRGPKRDGKVYTREQYEVQRKNRNNVMIERIEKWLKEAKELNEKGLL